MMASDRGIHSLSTMVSNIEQRFGVAEKRLERCGTHGDYVSRHVVRNDHDAWSDCPDCAAAQESKRAQDELAVERQRRKIQHIEQLLGRAAIPPRFQGKTFDSYNIESDEQALAIARCREYVESLPERLKDGRCLVLLGPPGTGKTHAGAAMAQYVVEVHHLPAMYATVTDAVRQFKDNYSTHARTEREILDMFASPALLVLDEIGAGWGTQTELLYLFEIINARYQANRPTVLAGNLSASEVRPTLGDRVADRLNEGGVKPVLFNWPSYRRRC